MICSDLDGTILTYTQTVLTDRLLFLIRECKKKGILFVPASGRQIVSTMKLFQPVTDCCNYVCSNGAVLCDEKGDVMEQISMPRDTAIAIARDFWERTDGRGEINLAGPKVCHLWSRNLGLEILPRFRRKS